MSAAVSDGKMTLGGRNNSNNAGRIRSWLENANDEEVHQVLITGESPSRAPSEPEDVTLPAPSTSPTQRNLLRLYHATHDDPGGQSRDSAQSFGEPRGLLRRSSYSLNQLLHRQSTENQTTSNTYGTSNETECLETTGIFISGGGPDDYIASKGFWYADMPGR